MILAISPTCPIFHPHHRVELSRLLNTVASGQNYLAQPRLDDLRRLLPPETWQLYGEVIRKQLKALTRRTGGWARHGDCERCDPASVATYYSMPTILLVENANTDGEWLKVVAARLRPSLLRSLAGPTPFVEVRPAGGVGEMPKEIRRIAPARTAIKPTGDVPTKTLAMADSDSHHPGHQSSDANAVVRAATETGAEAHILGKRSIENYIPDEALRGYGQDRQDRQAAISYILTLSDVQRDHYPMKSGLTEEDLRRPGSVFPPEAPLHVMVGDFIADLMRIRTHSIDAAGLGERDSVGELEQLLDLVERSA